MNGERRCMVCRCTDDDCSQCVEATGEPCSWVTVNDAGALCSRCFDEAVELVGVNPCAPILELQRGLRLGYARSTRVFDALRSALSEAL